jgi:hypothetical protein
MGVQVPVEHNYVRRPQWLERWSYEPNVVGSNPSWNTPSLNLLTKHVIYTTTVSMFLTSQRLYIGYFIVHISNWENTTALNERD